MRIDCFQAPSAIDVDIRDKTVIVIDVLRATSVIITALENGARQVIAVNEVTQAVELEKKLGGANIMLCGERDSLKIEGFDLSNSPLEYTAQSVGDKVIIMSTTNGTRAINACKDARTLLLGGFLNAKSVAELAIERRNDIVLACAGTHGRYSLDDIICAGAIISRIDDAFEGSVGMCDLSFTALKLYNLYSDDVDSVLKGSRHYETLVKNGFEQDIAFCLRQDVYSTVPVYTDGIIRR